MPDTKITALTAISTVNPATYPLPIVDTADTTMAASGTTKKITVNQILGAGGTATLASATITGDLTVDTSTLKVDSANNRVGLGTASPQYPLDVRGGNISAGNGTIFGGISYSTRTSIGSFSNHDLDLITNGNVQYLVTTTGNHTWYNSGSTAMTLNSTGLGVGVSPSYKLDVLGSATISGRFKTSGALNALYLEDGGTTPGSLYIGTSGDTFRIITGSNVRMNVDVNGNVGIGVTPSAWGSAFKVVQLRSGSLMADSGGTTLYNVQNVYFDGSNWLRINAAASTRYEQSVGVHSWWTGTSGSAGLSPTFTQAMTLDASGRLILLASTTTPATLSTNGQLTFTATSDTNLRFSYRGSDGVTRVANITLA